MTGKVCDKHQEWCPTGECRWCEPEKPVFAVVHLRTCASIVDPAAPCDCPRTATEAAIFARRTRERLDAAKALIASGMNPALAASCAFDHYASCPLREGSRRWLHLRSLPMKTRYHFNGDGETRSFDCPEPPKPGPDATCGRCGSSPVTHAEYRTGGVFTPPPFGVWMFLCSSCASGPHRSR